LEANELTEVLHGMSLCTKLQLFWGDVKWWTCGFHVQVGWGSFGAFDGGWDENWFLRLPVTHSFSLTFFDSYFFVTVLLVSGVLR
jgi:hypothetical protein